MDAVVPQLDGWAEVAFRAQYLPEFLFCVHSYFFHLLIKLYNHLVVSRNQRLLRCDQSPADWSANLASEFAK
jgi:hypothetical protein